MGYRRKIKGFGGTSQKCQHLIRILRENRVNGVRALKAILEKEITELKKNITQVEEAQLLCYQQEMYQ